VNELDQDVARMRTRGPQPLALDGWDRASIWGWDETTSSLYADLRPNGGDPHEPSAIRIAPDDFTPAITVLPTLAQYIAMAVNCDPWKVLTVLDRSVDQDENYVEKNVERGATGTVVTMTDGYDIW
jgi:hypothetical protein